MVTQKSNVKWIVEHEAGLGSATKEADTLIDLLMNHREICEHYGVTKRWIEGRYVIEKYHDGVTVKRYASIYKHLLVKVEVIENRKKNKSMIEQIIGLMTSLLDDLPYGMSDLFGGIGDARSETPKLMKTGLLIENNCNNKPKKTLKRDSYHRMVMKIPR